MTALTTLLADIGPTSVGNIPQRLRVWNTSHTSAANGGCCCLWTVPAGITSLVFKLWGGGSSGNDGCCCSFEAYQGTSGSYVWYQMDTQAGCQYRICAGSSTGCAYDKSNTSCYGCPSYVYDVTAAATIICACGGDEGSQQPGFQSPYNAYTCCFGRIQGGSSSATQGYVADANKGIIMPGIGGHGTRNTYCHTQYYYWTHSGFNQPGQMNEDLCSCWYQQGRYVMCTSGDPFTGNKFPGGPGTSGIACGGSHCDGQPGGGGKVYVYYN